MPLFFLNGLLDGAKELQDRPNSAPSPSGSGLYSFLSRFRDNQISDLTTEHMDLNDAF